MQNYKKKFDYQGRFANKKRTYSFTFSPIGLTDGKTRGKNSPSRRNSLTRERQAMNGTKRKCGRGLENARLFPYSSNLFLVIQRFWKTRRPGHYQVIGVSRVANSSGETFLYRPEPKKASRHIKHMLNNFSSPIWLGS
jgi:hypothetical protein